MKKIIFTCLLFALSLQGVYAAPVEVSCNTYPSSLTNACDQCFDGGFVYEGRGKTVTDILNNNSSSAIAVYLLNENATVWQADVLQSSTTWSTSTDLLRYSSGLNSSTSPTLGGYYYFLPNTSTQFLETNVDRGFRLDNAGIGTNRNAPAYKFQFIANLRSLSNGALSAPREHRECVFYNPAWCGDSVVDADQGEQCDDGNSDETDGCNNSCQIVTPITYDLALTKTVNTGASTISAGGTVQYDITVVNQGSVDASGIVITDYIPTGLTLNDAAWAQSGALATRTIASLTAGSSTTLSITFDISGTAIGNIVNWAEISSDDGDDIDSTPDQSNVNDCHGGNGGSGIGVNTIDTNVDNLLTGIGDNDGDGICEEGEDEDDHDPALITIGDYDLALVKTLVGAQTSFFNGQNVTFNITVTNQGDVTANTIQVIDYVPAGLIINDLTWTALGANVVQTLPALAAGASTTIPITFTVDGTVLGTITNFAEISADDGLDCDSTPDSDSTNDGTVTDNDIGTACDVGGDEDDHDPASITVVEPSYDLALAKTVSGATTSFNIGDSVTFDIVVSNQGGINANNIVITDYIPTGLTLNDATWTQVGTQATQTIATLSAGSSTTLPITFTLNASAVGTITNLAEISVDDGDDCDSTPDSDSANDGTVTDNDIGTACDVGGDEDDHDPASITVIGPTIEVLKYSANTADQDGNTDDSNITNDTQTITQNAAAVFHIVVTNNGTEDLNTIALTDALAAVCNRTDAQTQLLIAAIGNNDSVFNVGESFRYTCTQTPVPADYTNTIIVTGIGVTSATAVTDQDTTIVDVNTGGGTGGGTGVRCTSIASLGTQVTCTGNSRVNTFRVDCDITSEDDVNLFSSDINPDGAGRFASVFNCPATNNPVCYVSTQANVTDVAATQWSTANSCQQSVVTTSGGGGGSCGNGIIETSRGEQCEAIADENSVMYFPDGCSNTCQLNFGLRTAPSQTGLYTIPIGYGDEGLIFDINATDVVLGNNMNVADAIQGHPKLTNNTEYDLAIPALCLIKSSGFTIESAPYQGSSFDPADSLPRHGYCEETGTDVLYPGQTVTMFDLAYDFDTDTSYLDGRAETFNDNVIAFTVKDDAGLIYDTAYFSPSVTVRVAKPTLSTTAGTTYFEKSYIANLAEVSQGIADDNNNFGGVVVADEAGLGDNTTVDDTGLRDDIAQEAEDLSAQSWEDLSLPSNTLEAYNGLDNVFIINGSDITTADLPASISQSTTFIIENADLIIDANIDYSYNVGFVVRGGNIIIHDDVTSIDGSYVAISKSLTTGEIRGVDPTLNQLLVNGSLYGKTNDLVSKREYIRSAADGRIYVGTVVSFGSSFFRDPAPLLGRFISEYTDSVKVAQ